MSVGEAVKAETTQGPVYARVEEALAFGRRLLVAHGLTEQDAAIMAGCLVRADLRGVDTHGLQFLPQYLDRVRRGLVNPKPDLVVERVTPIDRLARRPERLRLRGGDQAMATAIEMAKEFGVGNRLGAPLHAFRHGRELHRAGARCRHDLLRLHQCVARHAGLGRREGFLAPARSPRRRPPARNYRSTSTCRRRWPRAAKSARGAARPENTARYALDAKGQATTDPNAALDGGVVLPIGGAKGPASRC